MLNLLDLLNSAGGPPLRAHAARTLLLLFPPSVDETEFHIAAEAVRRSYPELARLAEGARHNLDRKGLFNDPGGQLGLFALAVSDTELLPHVAGYPARRLLAAFLVEALARRGPGRTLAELAQMLQVELRSLQGDPGARAPLPDPAGLAELIDILGKEELDQDRMP